MVVAVSSPHGELFNPSKKKIKPTPASQNNHF